MTTTENKGKEGRLIETCPSCSKYAPIIYKSNVGTDFVGIGFELYGSEFRLSRLGLERAIEIFAGFLPAIMNEQFNGPARDYIGCIVRQASADTITAELTRVLRNPENLMRLPMTKSEVLRYSRMLCDRGGRYRVSREASHEPVRN